MNSLILLRGLPGAGKSELAGLLSENNKYPVFSVDDYFTNYKTGEYKFIHTENHLAYKLCADNTEKEMIKANKKIIIHNTFTIPWELDVYFDLAKTYNYRIYVCTIENYHNEKNIHSISDEQLRKMAEKYKVKLF